MLYYYNYLRRYARWTIYAYGFACLMFWSFNSYFRSDDLVITLLGAIGLVVGLVWLRHLLVISGMIDSSARFKQASDGHSRQWSDQLLAKQALIKRLDNYNTVGQVSAEANLKVTKIDKHTYHCQLTYYDQDDDIFYSNDYQVSRRRKQPVYIARSETLFPALSGRGSVLYQAERPQPASHDELFKLYQQLA